MSDLIMNVRLCVTDNTT